MDLTLSASGDEKKKVFSRESLLLGPFRLATKWKPTQTCCHAEPPLYGLRFALFFLLSGLKEMSTISDFAAKKKKKILQISLRKCTEKCLTALGPICVGVKNMPKENNGQKACGEGALKASSHLCFFFLKNFYPATEIPRQDKSPALSFYLQKS